jgi:gliding motility-associated-like protein
MKKNLIILIFCTTLFPISVYSQLSYVVLNSPSPGICLGNEIKLNAVPNWIASGEFTPVTLSWKSVPAIPFIPLTTSTILAKPTVTTKFIVTAIDDVYPNIVKRDSIIIIVHLPPALKIIYPSKDSSSCLNQPVEFIGKVENIKGKPTWSTNGKGTLKVDPDYDLHATYTPLLDETGIISVTLSGDPLDYCQTASATTSRLLEFVSKPLVSLTPASVSIYNSTVNPLQLNGTVSNNTSYDWRVVPKTAGTLSSNTILNPTFMPDPKYVGIATIYLDAYNKGCVASAASVVTISKFTLPLYPNKNPSLCKGVKDTLEVGFCNGCTYKWSTGETTSRIFITPTQNTKIDVEVKSSQGGVFRDTFNITVNNNPVITGIVPYPAEKKFEVLPSGYTWYKFFVKGETVQSGKDNTFNFENYISLTNKIDIRVINEWDCKADSFYYIVPNKPDAFTPNGDGINDILLPGWHITVFDRTQKILFDGNEGWDGRFNGREMPVGTYFYVLYDWNDKIAYKGPVTLLRSSISK